jgi:hypothetical protein
MLFDNRGKVANKEYQYVQSACNYTADTCPVIIEPFRPF